MFCSTQVGVPPTGIRVAQLHLLDHLIRELLSSPCRIMRGEMGQAQGTAPMDVIRSLLQPLAQWARPARPASPRTSQVPPGPPRRPPHSRSGNVAASARRASGTA